MNLPALSPEATNFVVSITGDSSPNVDLLMAGQLEDLRTVLEIELKSQLGNNSSSSEAKALAGIIGHVKRRATATPCQCWRDRGRMAPAIDRPLVPYGILDIRQQRRRDTVKPSGVLESKLLHSNRH